MPVSFVVILFCSILHFLAFITVSHLLRVRGSQGRKEAGKLLKGGSSNVFTQTRIVLCSLGRIPIFHDQWHVSLLLYWIDWWVDWRMTGLSVYWLSKMRELESWMMDKGISSQEWPWKAVSHTVMQWGISLQMKCTIFLMEPVNGGVSCTSCVWLVGPWSSHCFHSEHVDRLWGFHSFAIRSHIQSWWIAEEISKFKFSRCFQNHERLCSSNFSTHQSNQVHQPIKPSTN